MRAVISPLVRPLFSPSFAVSVLLVPLFLWFGLGPSATSLLDGVPFERSGLIRDAFLHSSTMLYLPFLAALPCASDAVKELQCGFFRPLLFRASRASYIAGKIFALLLIPALVQILGLILFLVLLSFFSVSAMEPFPLSMLVARFNTASFFAFAGGIGALLTQDVLCGYMVPVAFCFTLSMLTSRFLVNYPLLNPMRWLWGDRTALLFSFDLMLLMLIFYGLLLYREVNRHA